MTFNKKLTFQCQIQNKTARADNWHKANKRENICIKACNKNSEILFIHLLTKI